MLPYCAFAQDEGKSAAQVFDQNGVWGEAEVVFVSDDGLVLPLTDLQQRQTAHKSPTSRSRKKVSAIYAW